MLTLKIAHTPHPPPLWHRQGPGGCEDSSSEKNALGFCAWNSKNARGWMEHNIASKIKMYGYELGNEPGKFGHTTHVTLLLRLAGCIQYSHSFAWHMQRVHMKEESGVITVLAIEDLHKPLCMACVPPRRLLHAECRHHQRSSCCRFRGIESVGAICVRRAVLPTVGDRA